MKKFILLFVFLLSLALLTAKTTKSIIEEVNLDSLVITVEDLTGERSTDQFGIIPNRYSAEGRNTTFLYLENRLKQYGLETEIDNYRSTGYNVIGTQIGTVYPDSVFIICAHYDSVDEFCADDNASGTAAVLEAARIFSKFKFEYTIVYALWDEEERGLIGSRYYAEKANENLDKIAGVLNMDMIGYDSNNDYLFELHNGNQPMNERLTNKVTQVLDSSNLKLNMSIQTPGTNRSDHASFWTYGYPAILLIEGFSTNDFNSEYHSSNDKLSIMNLDYYHQVSQLTIASLFELAVFDSLIVVEDTENISEVEFELYPNPTTEYLYVKRLTDSESINIMIIDLEGKEILSIEPQSLLTKTDISQLASGLYTIVVSVGDNYSSKKFIKL